MNRTTKQKRKLRERLFKEQGGLCLWCRGQMVLEPHISRPTNPLDDYATFEHIIPKSQGGRFMVSNLALACYRCNVIRGNSFVVPRDVKPAHSAADVIALARTRT